VLSQGSVQEKPVEQRNLQTTVEGHHCIPLQQGIVTRSATQCKSSKPLSKSLHPSAVRGMLKQIARGVSLGDDGVMMRACMPPPWGAGSGQIFIDYVVLARKRSMRTNSKKNISSRRMLSWWAHESMHARPNFLHIWYSQEMHVPLTGSCTLAAHSKMITHMRLHVGQGFNKTVAAHR